jgi:hypothetical protein
VRWSLASRKGAWALRPRGDFRGAHFLDFAVPYCLLTDSFGPDAYPSGLRCISRRLMQWPGGRATFLRLGRLFKRFIYGDPSFEFMDGTQSPERVSSRRTTLAPIKQIG